MDLDELVGAWTHFYHVTYAVNLPLIRKRQAILPAAALLCEAGRPNLIACRRTHDLPLTIKGQDLVIRNQIALRPESLELDAGTVNEYVSSLNARAYFWPGTIAGPAEEGVRMFQRAGRASIMIRTCGRSLVLANPRAPMHVSACNTGAAWSNDGKRSRRGAEVFEPLDRFSQSVAHIIEISFGAPMQLPAEASYAEHPAGPWLSFLRHE